MSLRSSSSRPRQRGKRRALWLVSGLFLAVAFAPIQDKTAPWPRHGQYLGKQDCIECHEDEAEQIDSSWHRPVLHDEILLGCETCHGQGKRHADDEDNDPSLITHPPKLDDHSLQRLCAQCHADQVREHGGDPAGFAIAGKNCTSCHEIHREKPSPVHPGLEFHTLAATNRGAEPVGAQQCIQCHPLRDTLLEQSPHRSLRAADDPKGCETCHGNGSLHLETDGLSRLISRPDLAGDGVQTCLSCHQEVDPGEFHWRGKHRPLLNEGMTCTSCHRIHQARSGHQGSSATLANPAPVVRNALCANCHLPAFAVLQGTIHQQLGDPEIPLSQGCGACHPGAARHAEFAGRKSLVESMRDTDAATQSKTCIHCHQKDAATHRSRSGAHHKAQVSCLSCHSPAAARNRVREDASRRCTECHQATAAEFRLPNHHPVLEGAMSCVDCHEPHSARPRLRDRQLRTVSCVKCHKDYRGPFVFAHQASRIDGCVACHAPHGSVNKRLLKQASAQQNCLQCHADFPSFHDQTSGAVFTNCMKCHTEVHGSNHSRYLFR